MLVASSYFVGYEWLSWTVGVALMTPFVGYCILVRRELERQAEQLQREYRVKDWDPAKTVREYQKIPSVNKRLQTTPKDSKRLFPPKTAHEKRLWSQRRQKDSDED